MEWFLYDKDLRHERVKTSENVLTESVLVAYFSLAALIDIFDRFYKISELKVNCF